MDGLPNNLHNHVLRRVFFWTMTSEALRNQVAAKWQDAFNRLNRGAQGISGLMEFSNVRLSSFSFSTTQKLRGVSIGMGDCCRIFTSAGAWDTPEGL
jgi:hypothetical protein